MSDENNKSKSMPTSDHLPAPNDKRFTAIELNSDTSPESNDLIGQVLLELKKSQDSKAAKIAKLSFEVDPQKTYNYASVYQRRTNLMPPALLKRIRDSEELIGGVILPIRARQSALFARPRANRFDVGFTVNLRPEIISKYNEEEQKKIKEDIIPKLRDVLLSCGKNDGITDRDKRTLGQTFHEMIEDLLTFGAFAIEIRKDQLGKFHSFRAVDAGTIYFTMRQKGKSVEAENVRNAARIALQQLTGSLNVDIPKFEEDGYTYVQVIEEVPRQVFTDEELIYWSGSPSTDINRSGYPTTPIERIVSAITTHINLTTHNKMYFLNGKAARNILVFKSQNLEESDIASIRAQMIAHINSSNSAFRMPVFGMEPTDDVSVVPLDPSGRDMEFQYLADLNKRLIFAAYQMSPDEVAALSYLSRGTNSQSLSESNNEWKLLAARDIGLRPLLLSIEDFLNLRLLPRINKEWAELVQINLEGLDADSPEREATRLQQDSALFLTMNDIMERVEKEDVPIGGEFPLNAAYLQILEKYFTKGQILQAFGGEAFKDADKDPELSYYMGDQAWFAFKQMQQAQQQQQIMAQQQNQPKPSENAEALSQGEDLDSALAQLGEVLNKNEQALPISRKELLKRHKMSKKKVMDEFVKESKEMVDNIMGALTGKSDDHDDHDH